LRRREADDAAMRCVLAALVLLLSAVLARPVQAALRAVVIGVNAYSHERSLSGSVNDAAAIAAAIAPFAESVTRLTDGEVRREAVLRALESALAASAPGDTLLVSFSGHGGRERVRVTPETPTGYREFWVMADFDRKTPEGITGRVLSTEIGAWIARAGAADVRVVLLADHCYSGKIYRSAGVDVGNIRSIPTLIAPDVPPGEQPPRISELRAAPPPKGLVSLAADTADQPVAEFRITAVDRIHGALSYAFAHALSGAWAELDPQGTGNITVGATQRYLQRAVNLMTDGQQYPQLRTGDPTNEVLFTRPTTASAPVPGTQELPVVALHVSGLPAPDAQALVARIPGARWEPDLGHARLIWERRGGDSPLVTGLNMFVRFDLAESDLANAVQKIRVADALAGRAAGGQLTLAITQADGGIAPLYFSGETLQLSVRGLPGPNLVVFDLTAEGKVQNLYPTEGDAPIAWPSAGVVVGRIRVAPDYGGDHLVAVSGTRSLSRLVAALRAMEQREAAIAAYQAVQTALRDDPVATVAMAGLFTADAGRRCDPELIRNAAMAAACQGSQQ
jgi:hypothetical protein